MNKHHGHKSLTMWRNKMTINRNLNKDVLLVLIIGKMRMIGIQESKSLVVSPSDNKFKFRTVSGDIVGHLINDRLNVRRWWNYSRSVHWQLPVSTVNTKHNNITFLCCCNSKSIYAAYLLNIDETIFLADRYTTHLTSNCQCPASSSIRSLQCCMINYFNGLSKEAGQQIYNAC